MLVSKWPEGKYPPSKTEPPCQADSKVRTEVVPTAKTGLPSFFARFTFSAVSSLM